MADIEQDIKFVGMGDTIEIWSNAQSEATKMTAEDFGNALETLMTTDNPGDIHNEQEA